MLAKRQLIENLVYWPAIRVKRRAVVMATTPTTSAETQLANQNLWRVHLRAVAENQDRSAYRALYLHFSPKIRAFYLQHGMAAQAEELTHEVFLKVWQKAASYQPDKAQVSTWLFTIVRNLRIDFLRKKQIDTVSDEESAEPVDEANFTHQLQDSRDSQQLQSVIKLLDSEQRNVIQKVYFEDKSHQITAVELEMTLGTVKSRVRSALKLLRSHLRGES